jgi:hypothetical protein
MKTTLTPAYGRDYKSKREVLQSWIDCKDFIISNLQSRWDGKPMNRADAETSNEFSFRVRYKALTMQASLTFSEADGQWRIDGKSIDKFKSRAKREKRLAEIEKHNNPDAKCPCFRNGLYMPLSAMFCETHDYRKGNPDVK